MWCIWISGNLKKQKDVLEKQREVGKTIQAFHEKKKNGKKIN